MKICVVGLGYVGLTLGVYLARQGLKVHGIDINSKVLNALENKKAHFYEKDFDSELVQAIDSGLFTFSSDYKWAEIETDTVIYIVTVGTTLGKDGLVNLVPIQSVSKEIAKVLKENDGVVLRSTVKVGVTRNTVKPILDTVGINYRLAFCPERTLEGSAFEELSTLPQIVAGIDTESLSVVSKLFENLGTEVVSLKSVEAAEMVKLLNNSERDLMFALANEIGMMCDAVGVNAYEVINAANYKYPRSNIKKPGPVGGPCLEKDPYILTEGFFDTDYVPSLFLAGRKVNESIIKHTINKILKKIESRQFEKLAILGFAFKGLPPTGDIRGSLVIELIDYIKNIKITNNAIVGHDYLAENCEMEALGVIVCDSVEEAVKNADLIIIQNNHPNYKNENWVELLKSSGKSCTIIDFWNQLDDVDFGSNVNYYSLGNM
ncbi:nucleotide sugar dehydrogenase [Vibrio cholerae]|uniref:nucleotide sugar dehydrogenase n=1 Tax=Vibrio cholerae TaxID=666 RepID=UPI00372B3AFD